MNATVTPNHIDCVCCRAKADQISGEQAVMVVLIMLRNGASPDSIVDDLCIVHSWLFKRSCES